MNRATLTDFMTALAKDDFLSDSGYAAGAKTWVETTCEEFGPSAGGLVAAAVKCGFVVDHEGEVLELTEAGAEEIARLRG